MGKHAQSIDTRILDRIKRNASGRVFSARDFLDLGNRPAIDQTLSRHSRAGRLRKVSRGLTARHAAYTSTQTTALMRFGCGFTSRG